MIRFSKYIYSIRDSIFAQILSLPLLIFLLIRHIAFILTLRFIVPSRAALASRAAYVSHSPVETCWTKHMDSPYLISGIPIPSTSRFWATSTFSCSGKINHQSVGLQSELLGRIDNIVFRPLKFSIQPLRHESRMRTFWCWLSLGPPPSEPCRHPDRGTGPWWCGEYGKTDPISCGCRSNCRNETEPRMKFITIKEVYNKTQ